jgi:hypothetical protein
MTNGDAFGIFLSEYMLASAMSRNSNKLKPQRVLVPQRIQANDLVELYSKFEPYLPIILAMVGVRVDGTDHANLIDQKLRADALADDVMEKEYIDTLNLMDGHGRIVFLFLGEMMKRHGGKERLLKFKINWVDIDSVVDQYHSDMFECPSLICKNVSIFDVPSSSTYVHLNFCWEDVEKSN